MTETTTAALIGAGALAGAIIAVLTLLGMFWRIALPWLRQELAGPVRQINQQVTNSHDTNLRDDVTAMHTDVLALRDDLAEHIETARISDARRDGRIEALERRRCGLFG